MMAQDKKLFRIKEHVQSEKRGHLQKNAYFMSKTDIAQSPSNFENFSSRDSFSKF